MSSAYTSGEKRGLILLLILLIATVITLAVHKHYWYNSPARADATETQLAVVPDSSASAGDSMHTTAYRKKAKPSGGVKRRSSGKSQQLPSRDPLDQPLN